MDVVKIKGTCFHISSYMFALPSTFADIKNFTTYIQKHKIDTIINVSDFKPDGFVDFYKNNRIKNLIYLPFDDKILYPEDHKIYKTHLDRIHNRLVECKYRNILVHCTAGINRSALVICYLSNKIYRKSVKAIIDTLKKCNMQREKPALTNYTFIDLLLQ